MFIYYHLYLSILDNIDSGPSSIAINYYHNMLANDSLDVLIKKIEDLCKNNTSYIMGCYYCLKNSDNF